jgi:BirA family transcriptional regulator, biotin operon repressor / biotin---[acetyl-CoA-carboxylase] ligase
MKPEVLSAQAVMGTLTGGYWRVSVIEETPSTQILIRESKPTAGDVITAEYQSAGRGRLDRSFEAKKYSALLFSCYMEPAIQMANFGKIPLLAGLSVASALNKLTNSNNFKCKWPNDILINNKKVAGLLCETLGRGVLLGIGINVTTSKEELPVSHATSIALETGQQVNRNKLLAEILRELDLKINGDNDLHEYRQICQTVGLAVSATLPNGEVIEDIAEEIAESGALILKSGRKVTVGDLVHLTSKL